MIWFEWGHCRSTASRHFISRSTFSYFIHIVTLYLLFTNKEFKIENSKYSPLDELFKIELRLNFNSDYEQKDANNPGAHLRTFTRNSYLDSVR